MKMIKHSQEFDEISRVVSMHGDSGVKISDVVEELSKVRQIPAQKARYAVRLAIDKGELRTDRNFKLHLTATG
ncbi:hypothetical protein [Tritonibacter mobilis]|uniref:hypothetical protein n=1 Tax=Tritonibacter mobilis TaxID=379347 RepID=UPI0008949715|nr:hypothetical protein [Tritonibacter mobilis]SDX16953.1 hypothetical protein SAMN05444385_105178 [Tritonibacter mobilis]